MLNFFSILLIIFIILFVLIFKRKKIKSLLYTKKLFSNRLTNKENNFKYESKKDSFSYRHEEAKYTEFYKKSQRKKMVELFRNRTKDKLKALKIAEELADQSTLPILRRGLKDTSLEVVERSASLIRKFK